MVNPQYIPTRGDIVWLSFTPQAGHEQSGHRPALVLSPKSYNDKTSLAILCPITSTSKGYPFEVPLPSQSAISGVVLADQIKSLDWRSRQARFQCQTTRQVIGEVLAKVNVLLK